MRRLCADVELRSADDGAEGLAAVIDQLHEAFDDTRDALAVQLTG